MSNDPMFLVVDLFCGFGGTTLGFDMAEHNGHKLAKVIAAVNHDPKAIESHWKNHPEVVHYEEDIRTLDLSGLVDVVLGNMIRYPNAKLILWASLECTNFSNAKGGQPRDADSRTLAEHLDRYILALDPDYIKIENVKEFAAWGPLDNQNKPIVELKGRDFDRWRKSIKSLGYLDQWSNINSANYGAYTSRPRLFGCFHKPNLPCVWPEATHAKKPTGNLIKWLPVKDKIDFYDEGKSIFDRKKPLSDRTIEVIYKGVIKEFLNPENTFLFKYYGSGDNFNSIDTPAGVITTKDRFSKVSILYNYKTGSTATVNNPLGSILTIPKANVLSFILNPSHFGHTTSTQNSCPVIIARQDKAPLYFSTIEPGNMAADLSLFFGSAEYLYIDNYVPYGPNFKKTHRVLLVEEMHNRGISDIKMRLLKTLELLVIQGFPVDYIMCGNQSQQKKFIGNSVHPLVPKAMCEALNFALLAMDKVAA